MKTKCSLFFCICFIFYTQAVCGQAENSWGKIPVEDLKMQYYPLDSTASAVVLNETGWINVFTENGNTKLIFDVYRRIKIFKSSAFDYTDISVAYYCGGQKETLSQLKARITLPNGEFQELNKRDFHQTRLNKNIAEVSFSFPNVQEGAVVEYSYRRTSEHIGEPPTWYFQDEIPTRRSSLKFTNNSYFSYVTLFESGGNMQKSKQPDGTVTFSRLPTKMTIKGNYFVMENAPAIKEEAYVTTISDYSARIRYQISEATFPDGSHHKYLSTWEEAGSQLIDYPYFGHFYKKPRNYKKLYKAVKDDLAQYPTTAEQAAFLYRFIGNNIEWDGRYTASPQKTPEEIFELRKGSSAELSMALLALLHEAGIEAYPVLSSCRSHGKMITDYPIMDQFNHLMVFLYLDGQATLLDTPAPYLPFGMLRTEALNSMGWLVKDDSNLFININPRKSENTRYFEFQLSPEGIISGNIKQKAKNYAALIERSYVQESPDGEYWSSRLGENVDITNVEYTNLKAIEKPFEVNIDFDQLALANQIGDFIYFSPIVYSLFPNNPFKLENRFYPVDMPYPVIDRTVVKIDIPEGYEIEDTPANKELDLPNNGGTFHFKLHIQDNTITIYHNITISKLSFEPNEYNSLKDFFEQIVEKQGEQIVLRKKA